MKEDIKSIQNERGNHLRGCLPYSSLNSMGVDYLVH